MRRFGILVSPRISVASIVARRFRNRGCRRLFCSLDFAASLSRIFAAHGGFRSGSLCQSVSTLLVHGRVSVFAAGGGGSIDRRDFLARLFASLSDRRGLRSSSVWRLFVAFIRSCHLALRAFAFES